MGGDGIRTEQEVGDQGCLGPDPVHRRALVAHVATYGLAFVPTLVWLATDIGGWVAVAPLAILVPHFVQDDGRLVLLYLRAVKRTTAGPSDFIFIAVDQTFHVLALFAVALAVSG